MILETLIFKEIGMLPELFLGISIIYFLIHGTFLSVGNNYPIIQKSSIYLSILVLIMSSLLLINDGLDVLENSIYNSTIANDYLAFSSKIIIVVFSIFYFLIINQYIADQKINHFEYILIILLSLLGTLILCSANDLITAFLAIELQSLAFYVMASFKKNSTFSIEAGLKYFILGAFSSSFFLFGSSIIYGLTGSINFEDFRDLFFWAIPGSVVLLSDIDYSNYDSTTGFALVKNKLQNYNTRFLNQEDYLFLLRELASPESVYLTKNNVLFNLSYLATLVTSKIKNEEREILSENLDSLFEMFYCCDTISQQLHDFFFLKFDELEVIESNTPLEMFVDSDLPYVIAAYNISNCLPQLVWFETFQDSFFLEPFNLRLLSFALTFIMISLFFKLALAPFHLWSPDVYEGSPTSSTVFFAVISKLGVFLLLIRIFYYGFYGFIDNWRHYIVIIAVLSILVGSLGGIEQKKLKSLLAFSSISHMGYALIAFNTGVFEGFQMLFCYLVIYMLSGLSIWAIFLLTRLKNLYKNKQNKDLADLMLLRKSNKTLAFIFSIVLFSIAGFPPMVGFLVKMGVFLVSLEASLYYVAFISILCSVISTFYYIRIIKILYFEKVTTGKLYYPINTAKAIVIVFPFYFLIFLFVNPTLLYLFSYKISLLFIY